MTIEEILNKLPKVKDDRNYWLVRADGGKYYDSFLRGGFIAIGYNKISLKDIQKGNTKDDTGVNILKFNIMDKYKDEEKRPGHTAKQLLRFAYEVKKNDIVLIPSENSEEIAFVEVTQTAAYNDLNDSYDCPYIKRKKIRYLKTVPRDTLDPNLYKLMFSHHTITTANIYDSYIDKIINSFFIKEDEAHMVLNVESEEDVKARSVFEMGGLILDVFDEFCKEEELDLDSNDFDVKLAIQSPGFIELAGNAISGILIVGIIFVCLAGGNFDLKISEEVNLNVQTDGIIERIRQFLKSNSKIQTKKKLLKKHMKSLKIKEPTELIDVLKELDKD
ncbi:hypothetical protein [Flagellimonas eckloniae]|uniref:EVE domain-containing protein n=1 Tax=Flagellimonas eckloniae TaxID=346185 RepID=A0A0Q1HDC3_9FLAO|nr:hypothetical protein [Allomuricauda eckloniae]KQC31436.1 hypothetical protein AAY42_17320 [Allomuricauda eckloniae]